MKIWIFFLFIFLGLSIGALGIYLLLKPKLRITAQKNINIEQENNNLKIENENLKNIKKHREELLKSVEQEYYQIDAKRKEVKQSLLDLKETQQKAAEDYYNQALNIAENNFQQEIDKISDTLFEQRENAKNIYLQTMKEAVADFQKEIDIKQSELSQLNLELTIQAENVSAAVAAAKRVEQLQNEQNFYRLVLSEDDILEIKKLREVLPYLRDKEPLNKVIYKVYYEKPYTELINRVFPEKKTYCGIYKITNIQNQMCYVGQSVNVSERWRQHIKRGVGAEAPTRNRLYPAMLAVGVENFTFELIEECEREKLDEREDFWQDYFHAKDFGYSIK